MRRTPSGLVLKWEREIGKAAQECRATSLAKQILPPGMVPYDSVGCAQGFFISNCVPGHLLNVGSEQEVLAAVRYLGALHNAPLSEATRRFLEEHGFSHYDGEALRNRLFDEVCRIEQVYGGVPEVALLRPALARLTRRRNLARATVLGHGDFQQPNLLFYAERIHPVDWIDFGLCHRFYELAHFLAFVPAEFREAVTRTYAQCCGLRADRIGTQLAQGEAADAIVRAGSVARRSGPKNHEESGGELRRLFTAHMSRFERAMTRVK